MSCVIFFQPKKKHHWFWFTREKFFVWCKLTDQRTREKNTEWTHFKIPVKYCCRLWNKWLWGWIDKQKKYDSIIYHKRNTLKHIEIIRGKQTYFPIFHVAMTISFFLSIFLLLFFLLFFQDDDDHHQRSICHTLVSCCSLIRDFRLLAIINLMVVCLLFVLFLIKKSYILCLCRWMDIFSIFHWCSVDQIIWYPFTNT